MYHVLVISCCIKKNPLDLAAENNQCSYVTVSVGQNLGTACPGPRVRVSQGAVKVSAGAASSRGAARGGQGDLGSKLTRRLWAGPWALLRLDLKGFHVNTRRRVVQGQLPDCLPHTDLM